MRIGEAEEGKGMSGGRGCHHRSWRRTRLSRRAAAGRARLPARAHRSHPETLDTTAAVVGDAGGEALSIAGDVTDPDHVQRIFAVADDRFGGCQGLLHAAATHGTPMRLTEVSLEEWDAVMGNLRSTFLCTKEALRRMVPSKRGSIVLVSSAGVLRGFPWLALYAATKSALPGFAGRSRRRSGPKAYGSRAHSGRQPRHGDLPLRDAGNRAGDGILRGPDGAAAGGYVRAAPRVHRR